MNIIPRKIHVTNQRNHVTATKKRDGTEKKIYRGCWIIWYKTIPLDRNKEHEVVTDNNITSRSKRNEMKFPEKITVEVENRGI